MGSISPKCVFAAKSSLLPLHHLGFLEGDSDYNPLSYTMREGGHYEDRGLLARTSVSRFLAESS